MYPLVSIIIPVYNGSNFLKEAIESALNQTYKNIEVLVINDGSIDNNKTENICKFFNNKIRYFYKKNGGVASALNLGIKAAKGSFFSWLSHDDLYAPNKIKSQIEFIKKNPNVKIVCSDFAILNQQTLTTNERLILGKKSFRNGRDILVNWLDFCTFLIDLDCFKKVGLFNPNYRTVQDAEMQYRLVQRFPIFHINQILITRRIHQSQDTKTQHSYHLKEKDSFIRGLPQRYGLSFFKEDKSEPDYLTYLHLGINTLKLNCSKSSNLFLIRALLKKPLSPRLILLVVFGKRALNILYKKK